MPVFFKKTPGTLVRLEDPGVQARVSVMSLTPVIDVRTHLSLITRLTLSQQANVQFLHTLGSLVFIYVFGERVGQLTLTGLSFTGLCGQETDQHGAGKILEWYKENRVSRRKAPVKITIGRVPLEGFVVNFQEDVIDAAETVVQWSVNLAVLPNN